LAEAPGPGKATTRTLFGTDGIRGVAGEFPLDASTVFAIGRALGHHLNGGGAPRVVIGQDTRQSSGWIADALTAGLESTGAQVASAGVITTPGIAWLAAARGYTAGVVISASHNPWTDNGIKVFGGDGYKLPDATELEIEHEIFALLQEGTAADVPAPSAPSLPGDAELRLAYERHLLKDAAPLPVPLRVVVDCANGAASALAPQVFGAWQLKGLEFLHCAPDGRNINHNCGALHPEVVAKAAAERGADLGICFDGDADRALFADARGNVVNGDAVLLLAARWMKQAGALAGDTVVATTMSNMGLEIAFQRDGIRMLRAPVGDKYVLEEMCKTGAVLGGEQSGHIIFRDRATTGDGLLTALTVLHILGEYKKPLHELIAGLKVFPQLIRNVRVREKRPLEQIPAVARAIAAAQQELDGSGRVVVRYSGTEKLCRVMVEAETDAQVQRIAESIAGVIQKELG
jgi:phosphoglucosamine mutase